MNSILLIFSIFLLNFLVICERYTTKYDNINLDEILHSDRLLKNYVNCLLEKGSCSPEGTELKRVLPDAVETGCAKCSEAQKKGSVKVIRYLIEEKTEWWNELEKKYDPDGAYRKKYEEEIKKNGFDVNISN